MQSNKGSFIWDSHKELANIEKHGIDFTAAARAFKDPDRKIYIDSRHSQKEERLFCIGKVDDRILRVRFTFRQDKIWIIGAGFWRKGRYYYEKKD